MKLSIILAICFVAAPSFAQTPNNPQSYMIFPAAGADTAAFLNILTELVKPETPEVVELQDAKTDSKTVLVWEAILTDSQLNAVKGNSAVSGVEPNREFSEPQDVDLSGNPNVPKRLPKRRLPKEVESRYPNGPTLSKRKLANLEREDYELRQLSTARNTRGQLSETYDVDESAGAGVTVYVVDKKVLLDHVEFGSENGSPARGREILVSGKSDGKRSSNHGTCAASKAVGKTMVRVATMSRGKKMFLLVLTMLLIGIGTERRACSCCCTSHLRSQTVKGNYTNRRRHYRQRVTG